MTSDSLASSSQLEARLTDELNFKNKYELLKIELETCKTKLLASKSREIELSESLHKYEVRANNSCLRGQDGEAQMMYVLAKMLPNYIQDTHLTAHSGDCIAEIPYKTRSVKMIFDRKNYDEKTMTKVQIDKAIFDAKKKNAEIIVIVYNSLPKWAGGCTCLYDSDAGLLKMSGGFDPRKIFVCTIESLPQAVIQAMIALDIPKISCQNTMSLEKLKEDEKMHENLATDLNEQFEYLQGILDLIDSKKINQWTREFQTFFLKSKRLVQIAPEEAKNQKLMDVFEKYFPEKPTGNFILDGRKKRKLEEIDND